jgi:polyisoprenoid-binding protein YceI
MLRENAHAMRSFKISALGLCAALTIGLLTNELVQACNRPIQANGTIRYRLDASQSRFMVRAFAGGLLWFKGKDHFIRVRDFSGEAQLTSGSVNRASLHLKILTGSLEETRDIFTPQEKQIINKELRDIVLEPDKYPEIVFKSSAVTGKSLGPNQYDLKITGDLTLHGITRQVTIPTMVTVTGNDLQARGEFSINRGDFNVKATSAMHGLIRVEDKLKFTFDIVGHKWS